MAHATTGACWIVVEDEVKLAIDRVSFSGEFVVQDEAIVGKAKRPSHADLRLVDGGPDNLLHPIVKSGRQAGISDADVQDSFLPQVVSVDVIFDATLVRRRRLGRPIAQVLAISDAWIGDVAAIERQL